MLMEQNLVMPEDVQLWQLKGPCQTFSDMATLARQLAGLTIITGGMTQKVEHNHQTTEDALAKVKEELGS